MAIKRSLGRGLNELLSAVQLPELKTASLGEQPRYLPIELLQPGKYQPRKKIQGEALQELADSIQAQGILQPLLVRPLENKRYEIIAGERRWRASQLAKLEQVPVFIRDISNEAAIAMGLIENIQREDLNAIEQAVALKRLGDEFDLTHDEIAKAVGKSRVSISNLLRLLHLESQVRQMLEKGDLEMGHARALLPLPSPKQLAAANLVVEKGLSVRATEELVRKWQENSATVSKTVKVNPDILQLQARLSDKLGAAVKIQHGAKGKGRLVIQYYNLEELEGILQHIT